jgi:hypothetical protein
MSERVLPKSWPVQRDKQVLAYYQARTAAVIEADEAADRLRLRLLAKAGAEVLFEEAGEPEAEVMLSRGAFHFRWRSSSYADHVPEDVGTAHTAAAALWRANKDRADLMTGYALYADGLWRPHSWVLTKKKKRAEEMRIAETKDRAVAYYGYILTPDEAEAFAKSELADLPRELVAL